MQVSEPANTRLFTRLRCGLEHMKSHIPPELIRRYHNAIGASRLRKLDPLKFSASNLRPLLPQQIAGAIANEGTSSAWADDGAVLGLVFRDGECGLAVNPGDRRAIYSIILYLKPRRVLEIGTHLGASTLHIAAALTRLNGEGKLTTVDIEDVNAPGGPWQRYGLSRCPSDYLHRLGLDGVVTFIRSDSLAYLSSTQQDYDLIFLDGDHSAATVYQEVSLSLQRLSANGAVLLHDYFPGGKRLFPNTSPEKGPFDAIKRIRKENPAIEVFPLGRLPWPTKDGTSLTTLALVGRGLIALAGSEKGVGSLASEPLTTA